MHCAENPHERVNSGYPSQMVPKQAGITSYYRQGHDGGGNCQNKAGTPLGTSSFGRDLRDSIRLKLPDLR